MTLRHLTSINDLTNNEIERLFSLAEKYLAELGDRTAHYRIGRSTDSCAGYIMATLFYEPSTRTRLSFESAMSRLGGRVISSADPAASSAAKGETLADAARVVSAYADIMVLRHPREGAATFAAEYASVPVINGGDGAHEHPTQTLCDLFTIRREKGRLDSLNVALLGDLKGSRTIHSLAYGLGRFGANIVLIPAPGMDLPDRIISEIEQAYDYSPIEGVRFKGAAGAYGPRQRSSSSSHPRFDVLYLTRFQKERWHETIRDYPVVNAEFLTPKVFEQTLVLHPLPRVNELDPDFDSDPRAGYFRQASYGVAVRMALISMLLNTDHELGLEQFVTGFRDHSADDVTASALSCSNLNCITRTEGKPRFHASASPSALKRCAYCDHKTP
ncbi:MAG: aspartate carbamoyltransferase [Rhizomicrobium sp.]